MLSTLEQPEVLRIPVTDVFSEFEARLNNCEARAAFAERVARDAEAKVKNLFRPRAFKKGIAAQMLGISRSTLWQEEAAGKIRATSRGLIPSTEIDRYLANEVAEKGKRK